ncbi:uncharacterized protein EKO05_0002769 [Ascochyta rabiei]|uniref:uncharacterized protein n=1 Tax=Didymella rabiei TaxID=5454 RepID=UPI0021FD79DC|nr:uncharacterized protein EKO05_0002769 [Ascochyta rabiei]UPX12206.1 hypothetical protein EKO05_0002769 [Ascochyta rabiei]
MKLRISCIAWAHGTYHIITLFSLGQSQGHWITRTISEQTGFDSFWQPRNAGNRADCLGGSLLTNSRQITHVRPEATECHTHLKTLQWDLEIDLSKQ